ncbi:3-hydroxyisobutyrate dehydrogenase family protein [Cystobacter fuscus DSM 2262]|uniref:3-hydroxyisobutyrate dehydrogenase family protein n=1 Tax=Cystobacter fuscus (strain ATCC 25194 / DSM 2262 / NBRC 100088 / M29) TaxID=1242864 RepID=S9NV27_CYSF2|nr:NAD(P)-dependent oxidoreductase [Cystobacter fuscus]EPX56020.1 3-hydroxyisobutyrate dehydrogenase family protein [Cystobacter fuscus DSM 2262]
MKIGFIGLGAMGSAMAGHLLKAGHALTVWNRSPDKAAPLVEAGARRVASPAEAAAGAEVVISSLADDAAVEQVVLGEDGLARGLGAGAVHVGTSTISPKLSERLADAHARKGQGYVAAPVLGRPPAAAQGKLFVMAAGEAGAVATARPVLEGLGQRLFVVGETPAQAHLLKLCCNFLIFSTIEQLGEVFALTEKGGLDRARVFEVLTESFFSAPVHKNYGRLILERAYGPQGVPVTLAAKDTRLMLEAGEALSVPLPLASLVRDRWISARARGEQDLDFAVLARQIAQEAGLKE